MDAADASDGVDYRPGAKGEHRDLELAMDVETWTDLIAGRATAPAAALDGRIAVEGVITKAEGLIVLLGRLLLCEIWASTPRMSG